MSFSHTKYFHSIPTVSKVFTWTRTSSKVWNPICESPESDMGKRQSMVHPEADSSPARNLPLSDRYTKAATSQVFPWRGCEFSQLPNLPFCLTVLSVVTLSSHILLSAVRRIQVSSAEYLASSITISTFSLDHSLPCSLLLYNENCFHSFQ